MTGASGFVGTRLVERIVASGVTPRRLSRQPPQADNAWISGDVADPGLWDRALAGVDLVFHLAGQTSVRVADADPIGDRRVNADPVLALVTAARRRAAPLTVVLAGTETSAGLHPGPTLTDDLPDRPRTLYDLHKLHAEQYLAWGARHGFIRGGSLRLTTVYGPGPRPRASDRGVLGAMIRKALAGEPLTVYGRGDAVRDFVFVDDVVDALIAAAMAPDALAGEHFIVGSGERVTLVDAFARVAAEVERATGVRAPLVHVEPPADAPDVDRRSAVADSRRFSAATGWTPKVRFDDGLRRTVAALAAARAHEQERAP